MDFVNVRAIDDSDGKLVVTHIVSAGDRDRWANGEVHFTGRFEFRCYESAAGGFFGHLNFPQRADAYFSGSLNALKHLLKKAPSGGAALEDGRWEFWT